MAYAVAADGIEHGCIATDQFTCSWLELEPQPLLVAEPPQDSGSIVDEAIRVQDTDQAAAKVLFSMVGVNQLSEPLGVKAQGHGID